MFSFLLKKIHWVEYRVDTRLSEKVKVQRFRVHVRVRHKESRSISRLVPLSTLLPPHAWGPSLADPPGFIGRRHLSLPATSRTRTMRTHEPPRASTTSKTRTDEPLCCRGQDLLALAQASSDQPPITWLLPLAQTSFDHISLVQILYDSSAASHKHINYYYYYRYHYIYFYYER